MNLKLIFLDSFESEFKGNKYVITRFIDPTSLRVLSGTNLKGNYVQYKMYDCTVEFRNNKLKIVSAQ